jgi:endoglucanase
VNLASAEFGESKLPGTHGADYIYPDPEFASGYNSATYYVAKGMTVFRLPFLWERLQRDLYGAFDAMELNRLKKTVIRLTNLGAYVIIDPHNYARYKGNVVGSSAAPNAAFADFWAKLSVEFASNTKVIFGLMNEPKEMNTAQWVSAANAAITSIRSHDAKNLILVPGNRWTGAHSWYTSDTWGSSNAEELLGIVDSGNNYAFEVHQYLDSDSSGTHTACPSAEVGAKKLGAFTSWLRDHGARGFLGEFGASNESVCLNALDDLLLYMEANTDVWLGWSYWAGGPWWGNYFTSLEPSGGADKAQMDVLEKHLGTLTPLTALPMDASGWVSASSNSWAIQGAWSWYSDASTGGQTSIDGLGANDVPYVAGQGMCLTGWSPGGIEDGYLTWGAGLSFNVNQAEGTTVSLPLSKGPRCYRIKLSGSSPAGFRAKLLPVVPMPDGVEAPGLNVGSGGVFDLCRDYVSRASWCTDPAKCLDATSLAGGIAGINIQAESGDYGGSIDYCVESIEPHD